MRLRAAAQSRLRRRVANAISDKLTTLNMITSTVEPLREIKQRVDACVANASDLLRAAKRTMDDEKLPNISFHLTILALEEIGKAAVLGMRHIAQSTGDETGSFDKRLDDHQFKLFWALWAPNLARGKVEKEEFETLRGMAKHLHEERLDAMYVSIKQDDSEPALRQVSEERAKTILSLAEARLGMEVAGAWQPVDVNAREETKWFLDATADPEKRKLIFGQKGFDKLAEIGNMRDWMVWLKAQFDEAEAEGRASLQRELTRAIPDIGNRGDKKWQVVIRLHSPAQSIRNQALNSWNNRPSWIKLAPVGTSRRVLDVEFTYHDAMPLQALGPLGYRAARMFVAALNIGSLGFWWWHLPDDNGRFYERLTDLNASPGIKIDLNMHAGPKFEWKREALSDPELGRVAICFGMISALENEAYQSIIEPYLTGLALIAKSDLHLNLAFQASERFAACLSQAMRHFGDLDGTDEELALAASVTGFFAPRMQKDEDVQELVDLLRQLRRRPPDATGITLERTAILKVICDAYLIAQFQEMVRPKVASGEGDD